MLVELREWEILQNWKRDAGSFVVVRLKAEAIMLASEDVPIAVIGRFVDRSVSTVLSWFRDWHNSRLASVVTGHAGSENAAKLTSAQKEEAREALACPPSESGVPAEFWDVPTLEKLVSLRFDVEYESDSSLHLLMKFCGMSFKYPDAFDGRRDEQNIATRMAEVRDQVTGLMEAGYEVFAADEVRLDHEAETRRTWLPIGVRTNMHVDREKAAQSYFGALNLASGNVHLERIEGRQNAEQMTHVLARFQRAHPNSKIAIVWDNASWHHAKELKRLFEPGQIFDTITLIPLPPYAPDHNPIEHVWNHSKAAIANIQHETPSHTFSAFENYIRGRNFHYSFENLPVTEHSSDLVQFPPYSVLKGPATANQRSLDMLPQAQLTNLRERKFGITPTRVCGTRRSHSETPAGVPTIPTTRTILQRIFNPIEF
ncbi:DDE superfamily endonuclease [Actinopolyspora mzabensis]|uniref:DDE superfamily endonuclease n=2 Tax=Actinopolyspora mzabensis TaxID=995066 RepID=A0A1G8ZZ46_ACTMZ|nr:DDE superfamily endonuclease [Actinopolyspora mzabensis]